MIIYTHYYLVNHQLRSLHCTNLLYIKGELQLKFDWLMDWLNQPNITKIIKICGCLKPCHILLGVTWINWSNMWHVSFIYYFRIGSVKFNCFNQICFFQIEDALAMKDENNGIFVILRSCNILTVTLLCSLLWYVHNFRLQLSNLV